jgi:ferric enterobactin receptor
VSALQNRSLKKSFMKRHYQFIYLRFFILLMVPLISAEGAYGQTTAEDLSNLRVSGNYQNKDLSLVLLDLSVNHRLTFHYDREELPEKDITISFRRRPLSDVLTTLLDGTGLTYELIPPRTIRIVSDPAGVPARSEQQGVAPTRRDITVSGVVQDMATGERLPFANVVLAGTDRGTTTNVDGYFTLFDVPDDTTVLTISHLGYQPLSFQLHPQTQTDDLRIGLRAYGVELSEVVVAAHREEQMIQASTGISQIGITPAALGKLPSFGEKDIFRSLQLLPGISGSNESSSGLFIRGGTPDQNLILFDGFTVYHVDHLFGVFSAFNANALKDLQLYKGGFEAKYGGRLSSVVDMTGKDGNTETFNIGGGLSLLSANAYAEGPFADGKGSFLIAGRRSFQSGFYNDLFDTFTESGNQASPNETSPPNLAGLPVRRWSPTPTSTI